MLLWLWGTAQSVGGGRSQSCSQVSRLLQRYLICTLLPAQAAPCLWVCALICAACCIRLQDEQLSEVSASPEDKKREQAHFKALQSMHGFSNASSGVCSLCHERNHDQQGCPHAPHNVRWAVCHPQGLFRRQDAATWGLLPPSTQQQLLPSAHWLTCRVTDGTPLHTDCEACCGPAAAQQTSCSGLTLPQPPDMPH